jgi:hypothetical protein
MISKKEIKIAIPRKQEGKRRVDTYVEVSQSFCAKINIHNLINFLMDKEEATSFKFVENC